MRWTLASLLFVAGLAAAQSPPPAALPPTRDAVLALARSALAQVPLEVSADNFFNIAYTEAIAEPETSQADALFTLRQAIALSRATSANPAADHLRREVAFRTGGGAVSLLVHYGAPFAEIHDEILRFGLPRAQLYTDLLRTQWPKNSRPPDFDPLALARECLHADGSFPYAGVGAVAPASLDLARLAYAAAAEENDWTAFPAALALLKAGRADFPQLDPLRESAALAMLRQLQQGPPAHPPTPATEDLPWQCDSPQGSLTIFDADVPDPAALIRTEVGPGLLALLTSLDPDRASEFRAQFASVPSQPCSSSWGWANPPPAAADGPQAQLQSLASLVTASPAPASDSALRAFDTLLTLLRQNTGLVAANTYQLGTVATSMANTFDARPQAGLLADILLDYAAATVTSLQQQYDDATPEQRPAIERQVGDMHFIPDGVGEFRVVAGFDPGKALARAQQLQAPLVLPKLLIEIASALPAPKPPAPAKGGRRQ